MKKTPRAKPNPQDIALRAIFARQLARKAASRQKNNGHGRDLHSAAFRLKSYLNKLHGRNAACQSAAPWDLAWSCLGCFSGILMLILIDRSFFSGDQHLLLGSFGASSLIIFGAPHSVFAQPRSLMGGQIISALTGVSIFLLLGDYPVIAAPLAVSLSLFFMQSTATMHPPGGATALIAVSGHPVVERLGYLYVLWPVAAGFLILLLIGILINNLSRGRQYPLRWW